MQLAQHLYTTRSAPRLALRWPFSSRKEDGGRDLRLDFLRGWCLFSMVIDHAVVDRQTFVLHFTGAGGYPMTGAHGFVFLSGIVFGIVYARILVSEGWTMALPKALRRALTLYLVAIALGFVDMAFGLTPWGGGASLADTLALDNFVGNVLLHGPNDSLMSFYFLMILLAPAGLWLMHMGKSWLLIALSLGLWLGHMYMPGHFGNPVEIFIPAAEWQLLFVAGLLVGYHRTALGTWLRGRRRAAYLTLLFTLFAGLAALQAAYLTGNTGITISALNVDWLAGQVFTDYDHNPPLHMLAIFVAFFGLYHLVDWLWKPLRAALGWCLIPIGGAALYVYIVHTVIVYYLLLHLPAFNALEGAVLSVAMIGLMLLLWGMVKARFLFQIVPR
jgi:hypothetical protein